MGINEWALVGMILVGGLACLTAIVVAIVERMGRRG